jgi:hypothetical protein
MPNYSYSCSDNDCDFSAVDINFPIAARDYPTTQPCPLCKKENTVVKDIAAPGVSYSINRGGLKVPETFKDLLRNIKSEHRGSTINIPE